MVESGEGRGQKMDHHVSHDYKRISLQRILERAGVSAKAARDLVDSVPHIWIRNAFEDLSRKEELSEAARDEECPL